MAISYHPLERNGPLSESELSDWEEAYFAVESYLNALQLKNHLLLAELTRNILIRASEKHLENPDQPPRILAIQETLDVVAKWSQDLLDMPLEQGRLAARGRLALFISDMPGKWQSVFLTPPPWPDDFTKAMRNAYVGAGPEFAKLPMEAKPLDLNAFGLGAAQWWEEMDRRPIMRWISALLFVFLVVLLTWFLLLG